MSNKFLQLVSRQISILQVAAECGEKLRKLLLLSRKILLQLVTIVAVPIQIACTCVIQRKFVTCRIDIIRAKTTI